MPTTPVKVLTTTTRPAGASSTIPPRCATVSIQPTMFSTLSHRHNLAVICYTIKIIKFRIHISFCDLFHFCFFSLEVPMQLRLLYIPIVEASSWDPSFEQGKNLDLTIYHTHHVNKKRYQFTTEYLFSWNIPDPRNPCMCCD